MNFYKDTAASTIEASVLASLSVGIASLAGTDSSIDLQEFAVEFSGDQLLITNTKGRALAVENFSSTHGFLTVTPVNEPGAAEVLANQNAYYSELRVRMNTGAFGTDFSATGTDRFTFSLDGVANSANFTLNVNGSAAGVGGLGSGDIFASVVQAALTNGTGGSADIMVRNPNTGSVVVTADLSNLTVTYDADTAELVFRDSAGRAMGFGYDASANGLHGLGIGPLLDDNTTGNANKSFTVKRDSGITQGDVINASEITLAFSTSDASFNFTLNGQYLDGSSTNSSAAMSAAVSADFGTDTATLQTKLNALMTTLNAVHPSAVFEYSIDDSAKSITFRQRDGGELLLGGFVTATTHKDLTASVVTPSGQGTNMTLSFDRHDKQLFGTAVGTQGIATSATLQLSDDDVYSMTVSDGTQSYTASNLIVDISDSTSTNNFANSITDALLRVRDYCLHGC